MLKIVTTPNTVLTTPSKPVAVINAKIKKLVNDMEQALTAQKDPEGVGLAASQVGVNLAIFITKPSSNAQTEVFINPRILSDVALPTPDGAQVKNAQSRMEGCLSIPSIWAPLVRTQKVKLTYQTLDGKVHTKVFTGFKAVIVQHEVDHLNGVLFTMRCMEQGAQLYEEDNGELRKILS